MNWDDLIVDISNPDGSKILEAWKWLIGQESELIMVTVIGDAFLRDSNNDIYWLNVGVGKLNKVAGDLDEFNQKVNNIEISDEWFMFDLVDSIKKKGLELEQGKVFSYIKAPILGGEYDASNFNVSDIEVHFHIWGQIQENIKDLPDGTKVNIIAAQ